MLLGFDVRRTCSGSLRYIIRNLLLKKRLKAKEMNDISSFHFAVIHSHQLQDGDMHSDVQTV